MKKSVFVCSTAKFPDGDAGSIYYCNLAKCLSDDINDVLLIGAGNTAYSQIVKSNKTGLDIISLRKYSNFISKIISHFTIKTKLIRFVLRHCNDIKLLLMDGTFSLRQYKRVSRFFRKHNPNAKVVIGILERYQKDEFENKLLVSNMIRNNNNFIDRFQEKNCYIVCISSYLEELFVKRGFRCLRVPFIFDATQSLSCEEKQSNLINDGKIRFIYAGAPSKKDLIIDVINGLSLLPASYLSKMEVYLIGVSENWLIKHGLNQETINNLSGCLKILGRLSHSDVEKYYLISEYSLLARDENKCFTKAGFPTKISESLFYCVVPITNLTSDLGLYLKNEINSVIIDGHSPDNISKAIINAVDFYPFIDKMRISANDVLTQELSVQKFSTIIKEFLEL